MNNDLQKYLAFAAATIALVVATNRWLSAAGQLPK
jgi:hypothetical protein